MEKKILDNLIEGFKKAAYELEELQVQLSLGKAEAKDKFENIKSRFDKTLHELENRVNRTQEYSAELIGKINNLRLQLALGKAETRDILESQRKKINAMIHDIELFIEKHPKLNEALEFISSEFERVKLELELITVNVKLDQLKTSDSLLKRRAEMEAIIKRLREDIEKQIGAAKPSRHENFRKEIKAAYHHLREAFT